MKLKKKTNFFYDLLFVTSYCLVEMYRRFVRNVIPQPLIWKRDLYFEERTVCVFIQNSSQYLPNDTA